MQPNRERSGLDLVKFALKFHLSKDSSKVMLHLKDVLSCIKLFFKLSNVIRVILQGLQQTHNNVFLLSNGFEDNLHEFMDDREQVGNKQTHLT